MNFHPLAEEPPAFVTLDHRAVLVAAWAATKEGRFDVPPLLVRLDAHADMGEKPRPWAWERSQLRDLDSVQAIANAQRHDDGGWVVSAMQFGLAGDVLTFFVHDYHRFPGDSGTYEDHRGKTHQLATWGNIHEFVQSPSRHAECWRKRVEQAEAPIWVDIDLDFATTRVGREGRIRPWTRQEWLLGFSDEATEWLAGVLHRAALVTVATEPGFCGGHEGVGLIVRQLRNLMRPHGPWFEKL